MIAVLKYELIPGNREIHIPKDAKILNVAFQGDTLLMWAKVNSDMGMEIRNFYAFETGIEIPKDSASNFQYLGTGFKNQGLGSHVFEKKTNY
jgi:hypothetical protein